MKYIPAERTRPQQRIVLIALVLIVAAFEILGRVPMGDRFLCNTRDHIDTLLNEQRLQIILRQVSTVGIIAPGVTQVIISGGIDLSYSSVVGLTATVTLSFAQVALVNGNPDPKAIFGDLAMDLPVIVPRTVGLGCGLAAGFISGALIACTRIPPFIATLGMMVIARGASKWWSKGNPVSFPTDAYAEIGRGIIVAPVVLHQWRQKGRARG